MARGLYLNELEKIKKIPDGEGGTLIDTVTAIELINKTLKINGPRLIPIFLGIFENIDEMSDYITENYGSVNDLCEGSFGFIKFNNNGLIGEKGLSIVTVTKVSTNKKI